MCLVVFSYQYPPPYHLILWANRDEYMNRKSLPANFWKENPNIWGGRDLEGGGTWLAIHKDGRFAFLTNYRNLYYPHKTNPPSRGILIHDYLLNDFTPKEYISVVKETKEKYEGYNLVWGNFQECYYYNNRLDLLKTVLPGIHTLSNGILDDPWPKSERIRKFFLKVNNENDLENPNKAFQYLNDKKKVWLPWKLPNTGLGFIKEWYLSSIFIRIPGNPKKNRPDYGTRSQTFVCIPKDKPPILLEKIPLD